MALSTTSYTRWWRPRGPVLPMYMLGRLRTPSSPLSTWIWLESYPFRSGAPLAVVPFPSSFIARPVFGSSKFRPRPGMIPATLPAPAGAGSPDGVLVTAGGSPAGCCARPRPSGFQRAAGMCLQAAQGSGFRVNRT